MGTEKLSRGGTKVPDLSDLNILVAEDDTINQKLVAAILKRAGAHVTVAGNGEEAVGMALSDPTFNAVLMDVQMPLMDGLEASQKIHSHPGLSQLPIIGLTGYNDETQLQICLKSGMVDCVGKPIHMDELYNAIGKWTKTLTSATAADAPAAEPVALPGINVKEGLLRASGNAELYFELLGKFYQQHAGTGDIVAHAIEQGRSQEAARLVHGLGGVAGNLGVTELHQTADALEQHLTQNSPEIDVRYALTTFVESLKSALHTLSNLPPVRTGGASAALTSDDLNYDAFYKSLKKLKQLLVDSDMAAADYADELVDSIGFVAGARTAAELRILVRQLDFDKSIDTVDAILRKLGPGEELPK